MPAFCTCEGRVLLAFGPIAQEQQVLSLPLEPRTSSTVTDPQKLQPILERIRAQGFALDDEESETGMRGIAAPVRDASSEVVAAVGLVGPVQRLNDERVAQYTPKLLETALAISKGLGYSQPLGSSSLAVGKPRV
jgi:DNA-binding IclR family transcriptional regulator